MKTIDLENGTLAEELDEIEGRWWFLFVLLVLLPVWLAIWVIRKIVLILLCFVRVMRRMVKGGK